MKNWFICKAFPADYISKILSINISLYSFIDKLFEIMIT